MFVTIYNTQNSPANSYIHVLKHSRRNYAKKFQRCLKIVQKCYLFYLKNYRQIFVCPICNKLCTSTQFKCWEFNSRSVLIIEA